MENPIYVLDFGRLPNYFSIILHFQFDELDVMATSLSETKSS